MSAKLLATKISAIMGRNFVTVKERRKAKLVNLETQTEPSFRVADSVDGSHD